MKVIITGVAGLLGVNFCQYLLSNKSNLSIDTIIGIDNLSGGFIDNLPINNPNFIFLEGDLTDKEFQKSIESYFIDSTYLFHFAAYAAEGLSPFIRQFNYIDNIIPMAYLVNMAIKYSIKRFIFTSSMATYGDQSPPFDESLPLNPIDPYGIAKMACEKDLKCAYDQFGLEYCIIVPHNIYGKYQNIWDPYRNVIGIWMYNILHNKPIIIYGDGKQSRAFTYVNDILPCLWISAVSDKSKNERINLGGKKEISLNEIAFLIKEITNTDVPIIYMEKRHEVKHAWSTWQKSVDLLDYKETMSLREGLLDMWEWVKIQPDRERTYWSNYEIDKNIYSYWKRP